MRGMIGKDKDLLGSLIHDVAHLLRLDIDKRLKAHNLTRVKWLALGVIQDQPHISQAKLATIMELGNATVGRLIDRLNERGFVIRENDPDDRRSYLLDLTPLAKTTIKALSDVPEALREDAMTGLSDRDTSHLNRCLVAMKTNLKDRSAAWLSGAIVLDQVVPTAFLDGLKVALTI